MHTHSINLDPPSHAHDMWVGAPIPWDPQPPLTLALNNFGPVDLDLVLDAGGKMYPKQFARFTYPGAAPHITTAGEPLHSAYNVALVSSEWKMSIADVERKFTPRQVDFVATCIMGDLFTEQKIQ